MIGEFEEEVSDNRKEVKENDTPLLNEKYTNSTALYDAFIQVASLGDLASIYRNRPCFLGQRRQLLVKAATDVFLELPCSRAAVYHYTGLLVHETVHHHFNKKENVQQLGAITSVREAAGRLLDFITKFFTESDSKGGFEELLIWLCEISADLAAKNAGRPAMAHAVQHDEVLATFKTIDVVSRMLSLMNLVVTQLLAESPDVCMKTLFEGSRHGPHFSWMWLHIATLLQSGIVTHLLESGAAQFDAYISEMALRKTSQTAAPAVLNIIQTEYEHKFSAISDVFNFLMRKRNPELQEAVSNMIMESLDNVKEKGGKKSGFAFFFKLVTCSQQTMQIMVACNQHLIAPFNAIRAIRQIRSIDKAIILPNSGFIEFIRRVVEEIDPIAHGKVFDMIIDIVYNPNIFDGEDQPEMAEDNASLRDYCFPILNVMMNRIVRIAHATGPYKCPSQHPAICAYASGHKLQFIIDSTRRHFDKSASIIQHLHAISIAYGESKAAEIALRFLMTTSYTDSNNLMVLMGFINTTVTFYPTMMSCMYREFSSLKTLVTMSLAEDADPIETHLNLLHNLRTLFDWELPLEDRDNKEPLRADTERDERCDKYAYACFKLYPAEYTGEVLEAVLADSARLSAELLKAQDKTNFLLLHRMLTKIVEVVCVSNSSKASNRKFLISLSHWYKILSQLAVLLKSTLFMIDKEHTEGISIFEELRTAIVIFLYNKHVDEQLKDFMPVFTGLFVSACFADSKLLFDESLGSTMETLIDEVGLNKLFDMNQLEDGPSVLDGLKQLEMRNSALDMLHSGKLKKRRRNEEKSENQTNESAIQRVFAFLDAIHAMCFAGSSEVQLTSSKQLAQTLLYSVCKDSMTCDLKFDDWDIESDFIHRHVEIDQRLSTSPLCDGILRILCETRSFAYCLPIMKSKLAVIINETERFPDRLSCSPALRLKLHNWVMLAHKGGILPTRFIYICDLERHATVHEVHLILLEVWRFMMFRSITVGSIDAYHADLLRGDVDEGLPNEREAMDKVNFSVFRIVIQNHLPDTFHLFPHLFPAEYDFLKLNKLE